jgi:hypothetical protein
LPDRRSSAAPGVCRLGAGGNTICCCFTTAVVLRSVPSDSRLAEPANLRIDRVSLGLMRLSIRTNEYAWVTSRHVRGPRSVLLNEIKLDDSFCKDSKSSPFEFQKYAELQTLCLYIQSGNDKGQTSDKEQIKRLLSELKHEVTKFLHYQKLECFWFYDWNKAFRENRELRSCSRFIRLENEFSEKFSENSKYVIEETKCYINWDYVAYKHAELESYITTEDKYLEVVKRDFASKYDGETDTVFRADFVEIEKALKCRRLYILSWWSDDQKFKAWLHDLWPFIKEHNLWSSLTPEQYRVNPENINVHNSL